MSNAEPTSVSNSTAAAITTASTTTAATPKSTTTGGTNDTKREVSFKKSYILSIGGLLRLGLIFAGWVSAAAVPKLYNGASYLAPELASTRAGYLFFSISGFLIAIALYIFFLFNISNTGPFPHLPVNLIIAVSDVVWLIPMFILSIVCAVREAGVRNPSFYYAPYVNTGAFASAAFFGFVCSLIYGVDAIFQLITQKRN